jgi:putative molybdopterin biosynthesis protein
MLAAPSPQESPTPIIGVPGYPVSAALTGEIFIEPIISRWLGREPYAPPRIKARLTRKITSPAGDDDYIRVVLGRVRGQVLAAPLARGAGVITSLVQADGIFILPRGSQGLSAGAEVDIRLYRPSEDINRTILAIGSHDITLDILAEYLARHNRRMVSANVGSIGGLAALGRGEAHFAGSHLFDPESEEFNLPYIRQYLPGVAIRLIAMVGRQQGLMVQPGNPKGIRSLQDLIKNGVLFVNRQRGSGTRVLLDFHLDRIGINRDSIRGYQREEYTHLAVAAAIASGRADCGLGIAAAAQALGLEFIHLFDERYDLVIPAEHFESDLLRPLLSILEDPDFRISVGQLPGYDVSKMGQIIQ